MASRSARPQARKFILAVDHDKPILRRLHGLLEGAGYEVHCAESANEAIVAIGNRRPNLVLTDIHLRESDGFELINWMRSHTGSIPVIAMSEGVDEKITAIHVLAAAKAAGADALLPKPFHMPEMLQAVGGVLRAKDAPVEESGSAAQDAIDAIFAR